MNIVNLKRAAEKLRVSYIFCAALKNVAGIKSRLFEFERLQNWRRNPISNARMPIPASRRVKDTIRNHTLLS
jgi:hypothetical protein